MEGDARSRAGADHGRPDSTGDAQGAFHVLLVSIAGPQAFGLAVEYWYVKGYQIHLLSK